MGSLVSPVFASVFVIFVRVKGMGTSRKRVGGGDGGGSVWLARHSTTKEVG